MFTTLGLLASLGVAALKPQPMDHLRLYRDLQAVTGTRISVWLDRTSPYRRGDRARVYVSADHDAYLTVLRIDTDGRVRVLFPQDPWDDNFVTGGRTFEVEDPDGDPSFRIDDAPGEGYVFAIASEQRFDYTPVLTDRDHWDYRTIADGQVRGDPYVAVTDLAERIVPQQGDYDYDLAQYDVEQHYDYPRFVCYDCHAFVPYYSWNPYAHSCVRFRVVIYDDPYYYPYRYYGGRRTVFVRPRRAEPRFVFVDNNGGGDYVTRIPTRPRREDEGGTGGDQMRPRRGEDVGGRGTIPAPGVPGRRIIRQGDPGTGDPGTRQPEIRPLGRDGDQPPQRQPDQGQPDQRRPDRRDPPDAQGNPQGLNPQLRPPQDQGNNADPRRDRPDRQKDQPHRDDPHRQPDRPPERRAEPQRQPDRPPERHADPPPRRDPGGGGRSGSPELRRRHP